MEKKYEVRQQLKELPKENEEEREALQNDVDEAQTQLQTL